MRLAVKSNFERDVYNLCVALTQKFFRTIDALAEDELMRSKIGALLEQLGELRLTHLCQICQVLNLERLIKILPD